MGSNGSSTEPEIETLHKKYTDLIQKEISLYKQYEMHIDKINVLIVGRSGAGKSTFLNSFFGEKKASPGMLKPETKEIQPYADDACPLRLYDSPGIELDPKKQKEVMNQIFNFIKEKKQTGDYKQYIHIIFYCVNTEFKQICDKEEKFITMFSESSCTNSIPIIMVLTQSYDENLLIDLLAQIKTLKIPNIRQIIPIVAQKRIMKISGQTITSNEFGEKELKEAINACLPNELKESIKNFQTSELLHKRWRSIGFINKAAIETIENFSNMNHSSDWQQLILIEENLQENIIRTYDKHSDLFLLSKLVSLFIRELINKIMDVPQRNEEEKIKIAINITKSFGMAIISLVESTYDSKLSIDQLYKYEMSTFAHYFQTDSCLKYIYITNQQTNS